MSNEMNQSAHTETIQQPAETPPETPPEMPAEMPDDQPEQAEGHETKEPLADFKGTKHKVKVDGKFVEVDYNTLVSKFSKAEAADKRFMEAVQLKNQADQILSQFQQLQQNPEMLVNVLGEDNFTKLAEQVLYKKYSRDDMSPEQRELEELRELKNRYEQERIEAERLQQAQKHQEEVNSYKQQYERRFDNVLKQMNWPKTPETVARIARFYQASAENGYEPTDSDIQNFLEANYSSELKNIFSNVSVDKLYQMIGDDGLKALRQYDLQKVKSNRVPFNSGSHGGSSEPKKARTLEQVLTEARQRAGL